MKASKPVRTQTRTSLSMHACTYIRTSYMCCSYVPLRESMRYIRITCSRGILYIKIPVCPSCRPVSAGLLLPHKPCFLCTKRGRLLPAPEEQDDVYTVSRRIHHVENRKCHPRRLWYCIITSQCYVILPI